MVQVDQDKNLQPGTTSDVTQDVIQHPRWPNWPTSIPGPLVTQPPPGFKRSPTRTEQTIEIGYNQETGEPGVYAPERSLPDESQRGRVSPDLERDMPRKEK